MATTYNRFNVNILCIADSADATDLQSKVLQALSSVPKLTVKMTTLDRWVDGTTGKVKAYGEDGKELAEATTSTSETVADTNTTDTTSA
ncbi:MAG: hypothetical protein I3J00_06815 [Mesosutterella multiformis]|nr:hypothetical protein [Mesosutterella multiformis]